MLTIYYSDLLLLFVDVYVNVYHIKKCIRFIHLSFKSDSDRKDQFQSAYYKLKLYK